MTKDTEGYARLIARHLSATQIPQNNAMQQVMANARLAEDAKLVDAVARLAGIPVETLAHRLAHAHAQSEVARDEILDAVANASAGR